MFKKKPSSLYSESISLGKTYVKFLKPTQEQIDQIVGGSGLTILPQINQTKTPLIDRFESYIDKFNRILGLVEKFGERPEPKHGRKNHPTKPESKESDLPSSLKDPWGAPTW